jgi:hypothetical protein
MEVSGIITDDGGNPVSRIVRLYRRDTGALLGETESDEITGNYLIETVYEGEVQRIVLDDDTGVLYNDLIDRVITG